ncbi:hypothetical protein ABTK08_20190, partial [Acinetobacter baumannii]
MRAEAPSKAAGTPASGVPDLSISVRQMFGIDSDLDVPGYSTVSANVPD